MTAILNASTTSGVVITSDNSGNIAFQSNGSNVIATSGNAAVFSGGISMPGSFEYKNRLINGAMKIAQRGTSATVTAGTGVPTASTGYPCVDRWFTYSTGANITVAQVAGANNIQYNYQITGAGSVTAVGVGQRIEQANSYDLAGQTVTLSVNMSNSLLSNVTWIASYANTANTFGTIGTPTKTQISTGTFTVNSTYSTYSTQIAIPAAATTGIEILFTVGAQTSGTWVIGNAQLEVGTAATNFDYRDFGRELIMCQRYFETSADLGNAPGTQGQQSTFSNAGVATTSYIQQSVYFMVQKRASSTITFYDSAGTAGSLTRSTAGVGSVNGQSGATQGVTTKQFQLYSSGSGNYCGLLFNWKAECEL